MATADNGFTAEVAHRFPPWIMQSFLSVGFLGSALLMVIWNDPVARSALMVSVIGAGLALVRSADHDAQGTHTFTVDAAGLHITGTERASLQWTDLTRCELVPGDHNHQLVLHRHHLDPVVIPVRPSLAEDARWLATQLNARILSRPSAPEA